MPSIPDHSRGLRIGTDTSVTDIVEFLERRLRTPAVLGNAVVYNFHNRSLDARALVNADLDGGTYVVPYQVSGVWGFMQEVLPTEAAEAPHLTYSPDSEDYTVYSNYHGQVESSAVRAALAEVMVHG
jgi:hypothetical protein